ncbi:MAG: hypothetical protein ACREQP_01710 [Candidatus Binatia bacterium]
MKAKDTAPAPAVEEAPQFQMANTRNIVEKNLFDPERGANRTKEAEVSAAATQRIRSLVLLGTAILGDSRYAIIQEPSTAARGPTKAPQPGNSGQMRLKLGDALEGFKLSEIRDKSVVFTKGGSRVEVTIDFFRPGEEPPPSSRPPIPPRPGVGPRIPPRAGQGAATPPNPGNEENPGGARRALRGERLLQPPQQPAGQPPQRIAPQGENAPAENP